MRQICFLFLGALITASCNQISNDIINYPKTWVYVELEIVRQKDTSDFYYYGQMNQRILDKLANHENYKSIFELTNIRYIDDSDEVREYADEHEKDILYFRTQDIVRIKVLKRDPLSDKNYKKSNPPDTLIR